MKMAPIGINRDLKNSLNLLFTISHHLLNWINSVAEEVLKKNTTFLKKVA